MSHKQDNFIELTCVIGSINFVPGTLSFEIYVLLWGKEKVKLVENDGIAHVFFQESARGSL